MMVAIKKFERQFYKDSPMRKLNSMEAYMGLLNAMHELLVRCRPCVLSFMLTGCVSG